MQISLNRLRFTWIALLHENMHLSRRIWHLNVYIDTGFVTEMEYKLRKTDMFMISLTLNRNKCRKMLY